MSSEQPENKKGRAVLAGPPDIDFSLMLCRVIDSIRSDPAQLRNSVYELARIKLQREACLQSPPMSILEVRRLMLALETAIERVETVRAEEQPLQLPQSFDELVGRSDAAVSFTPPPPEPVLIVDRSDRLIPYIDSPGTAPTVTYVPLEHARRRSSRIARIVAGTAGAALAGVLVFSGVVLVLLSQRLALLSPVAPPTPKAASEIGDLGRGAKMTAPLPPPAAATNRAATTPLPGVYGVYALVGGELRELEALPGRVPDQKVFMSALIKAPSRTVLANGTVAFVVYRRDIASNAPDRVAVRIIAKIKRAMTFSADGKASTATIDDEWSIRGRSYEFRVAPLTDNPEMLMIRPENADFALPPGRYGLVLKGQAYDFTIAGSITEAVQCLERVEAANGSFYSECRTP